MILDNMTDKVLPSSQVSDYRPILSFNAYGRWTHGYRVTKPQPVQFAAR
jgi:predicted transglutaminase-like cysteine proteinase